MRGELNSADVFKITNSAAYVIVRYLSAVLPMLGNREFELKLALSEEDYERLNAHPKLTGPQRERSEKVLKSVYFDTPDLCLRDLGVTLRVRSDGKGFLQTVKAETGLENGVSSPIEVETPVENPEPDLDRIGDKSLRKKLLKAIGGSSLERAFETVVTRTSYRLETGDSLVELALDRGEARAKRRKTPICEAELELIEGDPQALLGIAQELFAGQTLHLSRMSKAEKGYRLLLKMPEARPDLTPAKAGEADVKSGQSCGVAFAAILRSAGEQITHNRTVVLEADVAEGPHQLRVGLTRLRAAHRALKPLLDTPAFHQLENDARTIARAVGEPRDADVLIEEIYAPVAGAVPDQRGFDALLSALQAHRTAKQASARLCLRGDEWSRLLLSLALWSAALERDPSLQHQSIEDYAKQALKRRWKRVANCGRAIDQLDPEEKHTMRRSLKKLRYLIEFFAPLFPSKEVKPFVKQLKTLQDVFGYVNDVRTAEQLRTIATEHGEGPDCAVAAGVVLGWHEEKAAEAWTHAQEEWRRLKSRGRFWM
jgi:inorganic triphosphatase YgiF